MGIVLDARSFKNLVSSCWVVVVRGARMGEFGDRSLKTCVINVRVVLVCGGDRAGDGIGLRCM